MVVAVAVLWRHPPNGVQCHADDLILGTDDEGLAWEGSGGEESVVRFVPALFCRYSALVSELAAGWALGVFPEGGGGRIAVQVEGVQLDATIGASAVVSADVLADEAWRCELVAVETVQVLGLIEYVIGASPKASIRIRAAVFALRRSSLLWSVVTVG